MGFYGFLDKDHIKVALNYQTKSEPMFLNQALFKLNGGSGFILKPPYMRNSDSIYDVMKEETWATSRNLEVTVISGNQLPTKKRDMIDPYIVVEVITPNQKFSEFKTKTIKVSLVLILTKFLKMAFRIMDLIRILKQFSKLAKLEFLKYHF